MGTAVWRLGSVGDPEAPTTVMEVGGRYYQLERLLESANPAARRTGVTVRAILARWDTWRPLLDRAADEADRATALESSTLAWQPPIVYPGTVVGVGANYRDHIAEMGGGDRPRPQHPFAFVKPRNTLVGHGRSVEIPARAEWVDWEGELAAVIGRRARDVRGDDARRAIAAYCPFNDVSARDWVAKGQLGSTMDMVLHKGFDGFGPIGPLITPAEFVDDPNDLDIQLSVNDVVKQDGSTAQMVFSIVEIVEHLASIMTLEPGDVISTGSPSGVGFARQPPERLEPGDTMALRIAGLGPELVTHMVAPAAAQSRGPIGADRKADISS